MLWPNPLSLRWRFTLRELFLTTLAILAFVGWGITLHYSGKRTPFFDSINWGAEVQNALKEIGQMQRPEYAQMLTEFGRREGCVFVQFSFELPPAEQDAFMDALEARICNRIVAGNCTQDFVKVGLEKNYDGSWFVIGYHHGSVTGRVCVTLAAHGSDEIRLFILVYEGRRAREGR